MENSPQDIRGDPRGIPLVLRGEKSVVPPCTGCGRQDNPLGPTARRHQLNAGTNLRGEALYSRPRQVQA